MQNQNAIYMLFGAALVYLGILVSALAWIHLSTWACTPSERATVEHWTLRRCTRRGLL